MDLNELRDQIDALDAQLVEILAARFQVGEAVGRYKAEHGLPPVDPGREVEMTARVRAHAESLGLAPEIAERVLRSIIDATVDRHIEISGQD
ncbi:MAG: chorismate mutase [Acidimicrobiia bacterium]